MRAGMVAESVAALRAAVDALASCDLESLDAAERVELLAELETHRCRIPALEHRLITSLDADTPPAQLGAKSLADALQTRLNLHPREAKRRVAVAADLGPRRSLTGQPMPPKLPATAIAVAHGVINADHVTVIRDAVAKIPGHVDPMQRSGLEVAWARAATTMAPHQLATDLKRTLYLLDQDGPEPTDEDGVRRRGMTVGKQAADGTVAVNVVMTAAAWAALEVLLAKFAAPGMCNPADDEPCTSGTPSQAQIDADDRTLAQRRHDALAFLHRTALAKGELGRLNGIPTAILIRTTLADLESRAGVGVTGGGTVLTRREMLQLAAQSTTTGFLTLFDDATGKVLDLFQTRRTATVVQRLALITRDGGCTKPGCTVPAYGCQVHHAKKDFAAGGNTNVNDNALACGADNRLVGTTGGWTTRMNARHEVEWHPPPLLDRGQTRVNSYHHPERLHPPPAAAESACTASRPQVDAGTGRTGADPGTNTDTGADLGTSTDTGADPARNGESDPSSDAGSDASDGIPGEATVRAGIDDPWAPELHPNRIGRLPRTGCPVTDPWAPHHTQGPPTGPPTGELAAPVHDLGNEG